MINGKNNDAMRELKLKELELVSGGFKIYSTPVAPDDFLMPIGDGLYANANTACEVLGGIHDAYGADYAIEYAKK